MSSTVRIGVLLVGAYMIACGCGVAIAGIDWFIAEVPRRQMLMDDRVHVGLASICIPRAVNTTMGHMTLSACAAPSSANEKRFMEIMMPARVAMYIAFAFAVIMCAIATRAFVRSKRKMRKSDLLLLNTVSLLHAAACLAGLFLLVIRKSRIRRVAHFSGNIEIKPEAWQLGRDFYISIATAIVAAVMSIVVITSSRTGDSRTSEPLIDPSRNDYDAAYDGDVE